MASPQGVIPLTFRAKGMKLVRAAQWRQASPISRAFLASSPAEPPSARTAMMADRTICAGVSLASACATAHSAPAPHHGLRAQANTNDAAAGRAKAGTGAARAGVANT